jgi:hypothetical protein
LSPLGADRIRSKGAIRMTNNGDEKRSSPRVEGPESVQVEIDGCTYRSFALFRQQAPWLAAEKLHDIEREEIIWIGLDKSVDRNAPPR